MSRHELKFSPTQLQVRNIASVLADHLIPDPHGNGNDGRYPVYSLYFDSPDFQFFRDKRDGLDERRKFRVRFYDHSSPSSYFFEMKEKKGSRIFKRRMVVPAQEAGEDMILFFGNGARGASARFEEMPSFAGAAARFHLKPTIWVAYQRRAFVSPFETDAVRVTVDTDIRYATFRGRSLVPADLRPFTSTPVILEMKFHDTPPAWLDWLMDQLRGARISLSKYATCLSESFRREAVL